ncbi:MAG TPA: hypothetical protein PJ991_01100 [Kiritimatiellia bacterium]|nr:hypothetical protein [Kiritimatiellia bacterium]
MNTSLVKVWLAASVLAGSAALAQKGTGIDEGIVRQGLIPITRSIAGTLEGIKTGPCKNTTGRAYIGSHLFLRTPENELINLHLGPANFVDEFISTLATGHIVRAIAFQTDNLKENNWVAKQVRVNDTELLLRDDSFRPLWAEGNRSPRFNRKFRW